MDLTIAIAVYNGEKYIERCIMSIVNAFNKVKSDSFKLKVLAINDGSKDNSLNALKGFGEKYDYINVIDKENGGLSSVRNLSIELCDSEYIWMIDIDDEITIDSLDIISTKSFSDINIFNYDIFDSTGKFLKSSKRVHLEERTTLKEKKDLLLQDTASWHYIFRTEFLKKSGIRFLSQKLYEDFNWNLKIMLVAKEISTFTEAIYKYYLTDGSIMRNKNLNRRDEIFDVVTDILDFYKNNNEYELYKTELEYWGIHNLLYVNYMDAFIIDSKAKLLDDHLHYLNSNFPEWTKNKYFRELTTKRKFVIFCVKYKLKFLLKLIKAFTE